VVPVPATIVVDFDVVVALVVEVVFTDVEVTLTVVEVALAVVDVIRVVAWKDVISASMLG
jgi:hypothetical protein